jgi:hypothetical protein
MNQITHLIPMEDFVWGLKESKDFLDLNTQYQ